MDIKILRSKRKTIALVVTPEADLLVRAPRGASFEYINSLIKKNSEWINRKIQQVRSKPRPLPKRFVDGEKFLYLGEHYPLRLTSKGALLRSSDEFELNRRYQPRAKELFVDLYKSQAKKVISSRVRLHSEETGLKYQKINISQANTRWGSCGPKNNLNFTWRLVMAPLFVIDYVVCHELAHLEHRNHSRKFWNKVREILPDYDLAKKWLKKNGYLLKV